jgi:hypothetical protein
MIFIRAYLACISSAISRLEAKKLSLEDNIDIVQDYIQDIVKRLTKLKKRDLLIN